MFCSVNGGYIIISVTTASVLYKLKGFIITMRKLKIRVKILRADIYIYLHLYLQLFLYL